MEEKKNEESQTPSPAAASAKFFSMPEPYRHGKEVKIVEPAQPIKPQPAAAPAPPTSPKALVSPSGQPASKRSHQRAFFIALALVLLAFLISAYLLLRSAQKQTPQPAPPQPAPTQPAPRPAPKPEPEPEPEPIPEPEPAPAAIQPGKDSDSDGLTDFEETLLYQTNPNLPDTDGDGFLDGNEVFHRYNPSALAPGTLSQAGLIKFYEILSVRIAYPTAWSVEALEPAVVFRSTTGEMITMAGQILVSPQEWVEKEGGQEQIIRTTSKNGYDLFLTTDKRRALLDVDGRYIQFAYQVEPKSTLDYLQTFQMMLGSVEAVSRPGI